MHNPPGPQHLIDSANLNFKSLWLALCSTREHVQWKVSCPQYFPVYASASKTFTFDLWAVVLRKSVNKFLRYFHVIQYIVLVVLSSCMPSEPWMSASSLLYACMPVTVMCQLSESPLWPYASSMIVISGWYHGYYVVSTVMRQPLQLFAPWRQCSSWGRALVRCTSSMHAGIVIVCTLVVLQKNHTQASSGVAPCFSDHSRWSWLRDSGYGTCY